MSQYVMSCQCANGEGHACVAEGEENGSHSQLQRERGEGGRGRERTGSGADLGGGEVHGGWLAGWPISDHFHFCTNARMDHTSVGCVLFLHFVLAQSSLLTSAIPHLVLAHIVLLHPLVALSLSPSLSLPPSLPPSLYAMRCHVVPAGAARDDEDGHSAADRCESRGEK